MGDHSSCRNPDNSERPWCYIAGPDGTVQRQLCTIDTCAGRNILQKAKTKKKVYVWWKMMKFLHLPKYSSTEKYADNLNRAVGIYSFSLVVSKEAIVLI